MALPLSKKGGGGGVEYIPTEMESWVSKRKREFSQILFLLIFQDHLQQQVKGGGENSVCIMRQREI